MRWTQQAQDTRMFQKCSGCFCSRSTGTHAEISHYLQRPLSCVTECFVALSLHVCLFCPLMRRLWGRSASRRPGVSPPHSVRGSHHVRAGKHLKWWSLHSYFIFTLNTDAATAQRAYTSAQAAPLFVIVLIIEDVYNCSNENLNPDQHYLRQHNTILHLTVIYFSKVQCW